MWKCELQYKPYVACKGSTKRYIIVDFRKIIVGCVFELDVYFLGDLDNDRDEKISC